MSKFHLQHYHKVNTSNKNMKYEIQIKITKNCNISGL